MKLLFRAQNVIQRDALLHRLREAGIDSHANFSDVVVKYGSEIDAAWGGYTTLYEGYAVLVEEAQFEKAKIVLDEFTAEDNIALQPPDYFSLFLVFSLFSIMFGLTAPIAVYFLFRSFQMKEKISFWKLFMGLACMSAGFFLISIFIAAY